MDGMEIGEICTTITSNSGNDKIAEMINLLRLCFNSCFYDLIALLMKF